jgi:hypothetical protein
VTKETLLAELFKDERQRQYEPPLGFASRVMARLDLEQPARPIFWESALTAALPVLALAVLLIAVLIGLDAVIPSVPGRGVTQIIFEMEVPAPERRLYADAPSTLSVNVVLDEILLGSSN